MRYQPRPESAQKADFNILVGLVLLGFSFRSTANSTTQLNSSGVLSNVEYVEELEVARPV